LKKDLRKVGGRELVANKFFEQVAFLLAFVLTASLAGASIPAFTVEAPTQAYAGEPITIIVHVSHPDQSGLHYVNDIKLFVNDELVKEWKYDKNTYVKNGLWDETAQVTLTSDSEVYATGCSNPGSIGFGCSAKTEKSLAHITVIQKPVETTTPTQAAATKTLEIVTPTTLAQASPVPQQQADNTMLWIAVIVIIIIAIAVFAYYALRKKPRKPARHYPEPHVKQHKK